MSTVVSTKRAHPAWALAAFVLLCLGVGAIGGLATAESVRDWYPTLAKPAWTPPSWLFGPVWTTLYIFMGVAGWLVWKAEPSVTRNRGLILFNVQLVANALWSPVFFGAREIAGALAIILVIDVAVAATLFTFARTNRLAAGLFVPYLAWVLFATALNFAIWRLNGG